MTNGQIRAIIDVLFWGFIQMADKKKKKKTTKKPPIQKINGHSGDPSKEDSRKINLPEHLPSELDKPQNAPPKIKLDSENIKGQTSRIVPHDPTPLENETQTPSDAKSTKEELSNDEIEARKSTTTRIPLMSAIPPNETSQVIDEAKKKKTTRIDLPFLPPGQKSDAPEKPSRSSTIRIKRQSAPTRDAHQQEVQASNVLSDKAETARMDLSQDAPDRPQKGPKKIMIKRSGTPTAKSSQDEEAEPTILSQEETTVENMYVILSLAVVMFTLLLIYLLVGQTYAPELPFPGRI